MTITAIKQQIKNPERVSIFVDGKYGFSLSLAELADARLTNNQELSPGEVKKFKQLSADGKLRQRALEWLLNRPHSAREFNDYMYRKKADPKLTEKLAEEFSDKGYLDDAKFADWLSEMRQRQGKSNRAIRSELFKKGVGREVIEARLADSADETERLKKLIAKKRKSTRYKNDPLKLAQYLVGQGFNYSLVKETLRLAPYQNPSEEEAE